ncbi:MAG: phasin family protein [Telluria sp.]
MSIFPEQFSEARKSQLDAQFNFFSTFTGKAFESAEKIIALNFDASRASLEKSSALMRQMMAAKDPRDLFALTSQSQSEFESVLAYSRQLFSIVAGPGVANATETAALGAPVPAPAPAASAAPAAAASEAPAAPVQASLVPVAAEAEPEPIAAPNPIAKAAGTAAAMPEPSAASFPVTSSAKPIEVTSVKPVEAAPPPAPVSGTPEIVSRKAAAPAAKQAKKK